MAPPPSPVYKFIHCCQFADLPDPVVQAVQRSLLDLVGVAAGGRRGKAATIACDYAVAHQASSGRGARLLFDGRRASPVGAAFAGAITIDSLDGHDGHALAKGHAGVVLLPALLSLVDSTTVCSGPELLTTLVVGYEIACRAGMALHASVSDYHSSGAWNALGAAAIGARRLGLTLAQTREALGIAEYYGPRSQIMRSVAHPTMVRDGAGPGAMTGVSAALLAAAGFTGAPAITVEADNGADLWASLGQRWCIIEQYLKPYPVCHWAQPAITASLTLQHQHGFAAADIDRIEVYTFHAATCLTNRAPQTTDQAQYSLIFPLAAALVLGQLGVEEMTGDALRDPQILRLSQIIQVYGTDGYSQQFPAQRLAHVIMVLRDGLILESATTIGRGGVDNPLSQAEVNAKFLALATPLLGPDRAQQLATVISGLVTEVNCSRFLDLVLTPAEDTGEVLAQTL